MRRSGCRRSCARRCVQPSTLLAHTIVYRQDAIGEVISQLLEPGSEDIGLIGVAPVQTLDPLADLPERKSAQVDVGVSDLTPPRRLRSGRVRGGSPRPPSYRAGSSQCNVTASILGAADAEQVEVRAERMNSTRRGS